MDGVEDTLFIPLLARIYSSKHFPEFFYDKKALELEHLVPKSMLKLGDREYYYLAGATRYFMLDKEVRSFIDKYKNVNIVNLGTGLDTMSQRIDSKTAHFYELDLPHVIKMREEVLAQKEKDTYIANSFFQTSWTQNIDTSLPTLLVASGVFYYFKKDMVTDFFQDIMSKIDKCEIIFDVVGSVGMKISNVMVKKTGNKNAQMHFFINNTHKFFENFPSISHVEEIPYYEEARKELKGKVKLFTKIAMCLGDVFKMVRIVKIRNF